MKRFHSLYSGQKEQDSYRKETAHGRERRKKERFPR